MVSLLAERPFCEKLNSYGGYTSNFRGTLSYGTHLDKIDNPGIIPLLKNVYRVTTTLNDFQPFKFKSGKESFCNGIELYDSGFTHERAPVKVDYASIERTQKEKVDMSHHPNIQLTAFCIAPNSLESEYKENFSTCTDLLNYKLLNCANSSSSFKRNMESGFTRNTQPNPTDGRVLDPVYLGQFPSFGRFGPSVTHMDFTCSAVLTGKEPHEPFRQTDKRSGYYQSNGLTPSYLKGTIKNYCKPHLDYETSYRCHYPVRTCNKDYTGFTLTGKKMVQQGINPAINLFHGKKGFYITETMERFVAPEKSRIQLYPTSVDAISNYGVLPKQPLCKDKPSCPDMKESYTCALKPSPQKIRNDCV